MELEKLEKNLIDNIHEAQLKLGFDRRPMSLNYTCATLNHLAGTQLPPEEIPELLGQLDTAVKSRLGELTWRPIKDGFCITVPAEGTEYVHFQFGQSPDFISELVETVRSHGITLDDALAVFRKYSGSVAVKESGSEEFDYLVYFEDGVPDEYLYCLTLEPCMGGGCHITYHRFIREDYEDFGF